MRASHEAYREQHERALSAGERKKSTNLVEPNAYREEGENESDLNERGDDILFGSKKVDLVRTSRES